MDEITRKDFTEANDAGKLDMFEESFDNMVEFATRITKLKAENARLTAANDYTNNLLEEQGAHINEQSLKIAHLAKANESMQEDAVQNTYAFGLMLKANKEQAEEIRTIKETIEDVKIYCNNPSAWDYYDETVSQKIRAILKAAGMA